MVDRNQIQSEVRSRSGPDRCIWHTNRGKSNQASNQSMSHQSIHQIKSINHGTSFKTNPSIKSKYKSTHQVSFKSYQSTCQPHIPINYPTYHCTLTRTLVSSNLSKITSSTPTPLFIFWHFPHYNLHSLSLSSLFLSFWPKFPSPPSPFFGFFIFFFLSFVRSRKLAQAAAVRRRGARHRHRRPSLSLLILVSLPNSFLFIPMAWFFH